MKPMKTLTLSVMLAALLATGAAAADKKASPARQGELILYQETNYNGDNKVIDRDNTFVHTDWNVRSIALYPGEKWQICNKPRYQGECLTLTDSLPDASTMGINGQVPSVRRAPDNH
jgi:opacity protein-like surface antigen